MLKNTIAEKYWLKKLSKKVEEIEFYKSAQPLGYGMNCIKKQLSSDNYLRINQLSDGSEVGQYIYILTALSFLLNKYFDVTETIIGAGVFHLPSEPIENSNLIFLRTDFFESTSVKEMLESHRRTLIEAYKYQKHNCTEIFDNLYISEDRIRNGFFKIGLHDSRLNVLPIEVKEKFAIWISIERNESSLTISIEYDSSYDSKFMEQFLSHFIYVCGTLSEKIDLELKDIHVLPLEEQQDIISILENKEGENNFGHSIIEYFTKNVIDSPSALAVNYCDSVYTYLQLDACSNSLAKYMTETCAVKKGDLIAVSLKSSFELTVSLIAILKTGGVIVPIDPAVPISRIDVLLNDSAASVYIGENHLVAASKKNIECIGREKINQVMAVKQTFVPIQTVDSDLAYIIYTSGSTGTPKAVKISIGNIIAQFNWFKRYFNFSANDVLPQKTTISFVDSILELLFPITRGQSTVYLRPNDEIVYDMPNLVNWMAKIGVSIVQFVPSVFDYLFQTTDISQLSSLHSLILTGEEVKHIYNLPFSIFNLYGCSEGSAYSIIYKLNQPGKGKIPIGKPIDTTYAYILKDKNYNEFCPIYVIGELFIGGAGIASGYLNQEKLTEERFIPDPYHEGRTIYRTGDYARLLPDGNIECLGRKDQQLKIYGQRIEPGEVEGIVKRHPIINEVVVWSTKNSEGAPLLSCFFTVKELAFYTMKSLIELKIESPDIYANLYSLPNKLLISPINKRESELLYNEIFEDHTYSRNGIEISDHDVIIDVGANIGLFTLYMGLNFKHVKLFAFEPLLPIYNTLQTNISLYNINAKLFNIGLAEKEQDVDFVYYEHNSALSGRYATEIEEKEVVRSYIINNTKKSNIDFSENELNEVINERITGKTYACRVRRLSDVIRENNIEKIDLLKIDVEKSEMDVLNGIDEEHWPLIKQIIIEVHDIDNRGKHIEALFKKQGFSIFIEQEELFRNTNILNIYASRSKTELKSSASSIKDSNLDFSWTSADAIIEQVKELCSSCLPTYMVPSTYKIMVELPRLDNGKINRNALIGSDGVTSLSNRKKVTPRNEIESKLLNIFCSVLGKNTLSIDDDFFKNGGHSLNATLMSTRILKEFNVQVGLKAIFDNPTIETLALVINNSSEVHDELIPSVVKQEYYDVSFNQKRLWILSQMPEMNIAYNISGAFIIQGPFQCEQFDKAVKFIIERHEILRTIFITDDLGIPKQKVLPFDAIDFRINYRNIKSAPAKNELITQVISERFSTPYNLAVGPLFRIDCLTVSDNKHVLIFSIHHIISDGWSLKLMIQEVFDAYASRPKSLLTIQYKDFTDWHQRIVKSGKLDSHKKYWLETLYSNIQPLQLPYDFTFKPELSMVGDTFEFTIEGDLLSKLRAFSENKKTTPFVVLLAAFQSILGLETNQEHVYLGIPASGRLNKVLETQMGFYVNLLPVGAIISDKTTFTQLVEVLRKDVTNAFAFQMYPFELIMEELKFERNIGRSGFINTGFTWNVDDYQGILTSELKYKALGISPQMVKHDLWLIGTDHEQYIDFVFEFRTLLFRKETIILLAEKFVGLLEYLISHPNQSIRSYIAKPNYSGRLKEKQIVIDLDI